MDTLRQSFSVPLPDGGKERYEFAGVEPFARLTVSVVLGNRRQLKRWEHSVSKLGLRVTLVDQTGDLWSFSVTGHRDALRELVTFRSIVRVEYLEAGLPNIGRRSYATEACPLPPEVRQRRAAERRKLADTVERINDAKAIARQF